ncbi:DUF2243 domain-containing protein [Bacillus sp. BGMRC 2118]|nr:DUF2243 domain-containing protein [Bacillus sp. BGMRC 2118]
MTNRTKESLLDYGSFILGFGFMGALDGIIFHQLLQWHSVYMATDRPGQIVSDGIFHFGVSIALVIGGILLWLAGNPTSVEKGNRFVLGGFLMGAGIFNVVEGTINHHLLQIHRVKPGDPHAMMYDLSFLALGFILAVIGYAIRKSSKKQQAPVSA